MMLLDLRWRQFLVLVLLGLGCSSPKPIEGVVRPQPGEPLLESLPGPMPGFGSFDSYSDALLAACPHILSKPNATAGRVQDQDFRLRWRISREYCAWLYYTPEHKYEMSMLTDQSRSDDLDKKKSCVLPPLVDDQRYPRGSLKYVFALHNHPYEAELSKYDIEDIVRKGELHGFAFEAINAKNKKEQVQLAVIAFFSNSSDLKNPTCDGFFQYIPLAGQLRKWTRLQDTWLCQQTGTVRWLNADDFRVDMKTASCQNATEGAP
jgi:hypothetical protein